MEQTLRRKPTRRRFIEEFLSISACQGRRRKSHAAEGQWSLGHGLSMADPQRARKPALTFRAASNWSRWARSLYPHTPVIGHRLPQGRDLTSIKTVLLGIGWFQERTSGSTEEGSTPSFWRSKCFVPEGAWVAQHCLHRTWMVLSAICQLILCLGYRVSNAVS